MRIKTHAPPPCKPALAAITALTLAGTAPAFAAPFGITSLSSYQSAIAALGSETVEGFDGTAADTKPAPPTSSSATRPAAPGPSRPI
jgi:hypothetical protein